MTHTHWLDTLGECKKKHQTEIRDICWSPTTPDTLVSCDGWGTVLLWDTRQMSGQNLPVCLCCPLRRRGALLMHCTKLSVLKINKLFGVWIDSSFSYHSWCKPRNHSCQHCNGGTTNASGYDS